MRRNSIACKIVVDGELIEMRYEGLDLWARNDSVEKRMQLFWQLALMLFLVDEVFAIFEIVAVVLDSSVVELFPLVLVDPSKELFFFLFADDLLDDGKSRNVLILRV